jgi:glucokinase
VAARALLVGDIGGTNTRLHLLSGDGKLVRREVLESHGFKSLEAAARAFLGDKPPKLSAAVFGVAGPVVDGRCVATNLPWVIDARSLSRKLGIPKVTLLNDLVALGLGAIDVRGKNRHVLGSAGAPRKTGGSVAIIAAGTGLGEALLVWDGQRHVPTATEGGHAEFGPRDEVEDDVLKFLRARHGHVSAERLVSGMGLGNLYDFFRDGPRPHGGLGESFENDKAIAAASDRNAAIAQLGMEGKSKTAAIAVERFAAIYGAEAGNLALKGLTLGGVLVCGNIAKRMLPVLQRGGFMKAFTDKGRFARLMESIPVAVITDTDVGLAGSTRVALGA